MKRTGTIDIPGSPDWVQNHGLFGIGCNEKLNKVYISNIRTQGIIVVDGETGERERIIYTPPMNDRPGLSNVRWSSATDLVYMTAPDEKKVYVFDPNESKYLRDWDLGGGPRGIDLDRNSGHIWIAQYGEGWEGGGNSVVVYDKNEEQIKTITVELRPWDILVDSDGGKTYVVCKGSDNYKPGYLCIINHDSLEVESTILVGRRPRGVGIISKSRKAYIACRYDSAVYVVDLESQEVTSRIPTDCDPIGIVAVEETERVYCLNRQGAMRLGTPYRGAASTVTVIDGTTDTVVKTLTYGKTGHFGVYNSVNQHIYMPAEDTNNIWTLDTKSDEIDGTIAMGFSLDSGFHVNPKTGYLYATSHISDEMTILDGRGEQYVDTVPTHGWPFGVAGLPELGRIYTNNSDDATLSVYDANTHAFIKTIDLGVEGHFSMNSPIVEAHTFLFSKIASDSKRNRLLITCPWVEKLAVMDARSERVEYVDLGYSAKAIDYSLLDPAINEETNTIYVWNSMLNSVTVIDGETLRVVDSIDIPGESSRFERLIVDSRNNRLYWNRYIIDCRSNSVLDTLSNEIKGPIAAFDEKRNHLFVAGRESNSVTTVDADSLKEIETIPLGSATFETMDFEEERMYAVENGTIAVFG